MPVKIFKYSINHLAKPILILINRSFESGIFPDILKIARITPVHKKGPKTSIENYRPISSLPFLSKIFERCMATRLVSFLEKIDLISKYQFGFQKGKSTSDALTMLTESIYNSINNRQHHISVLIDLSKAFDTVNLRILLEKLEKYGIKNSPLDLFKSYLLNRKNYVKIKSHSSTMNTSNIGVPQGSILGPMLFLIYVNDLPCASNLLEPIIFADDTTLSISDHNPSVLVSNLNSELMKVQSWCNSNRLTINAAKTEMMMFTNRNVDLSQLNVTLDSELLEFKSSCTLLGVKIDDNLSYKNHIQHITNKISKNTGILYRIRDELPLSARKNFYYAYIYPYLNYNIILWGSTSQNHIQPLNIQHKRCIRTICNSKRLDHTAPLFKELGFLQLQDIFRYNICIYMHREFYRGNFLVTNARNTRQTFSSFAAPSFQRLSQTQHAVSFTGPTTWNTIPSNIRNIDSLMHFKRKLKIHFIDQYI